MAITVGSTIPFTPFSPGGTQQSATVLSFPVTSADPISKGDVLILATGLALVDNTDPADASILGVAMEAKASVASAGYTDQVLVACALPGALFLGNLVGDATTDYTANAAAAIVPDLDIVELTVQGYPCVDAGTTTGNIQAIQFAPMQLGGKTFTAFGNTLIVNPLIVFTFSSSAFQPLAP